MKKLFLAFGLFSTSVVGYAQSCSDPVFCGNTSCWLLGINPPLNFSFNFQPAFIRTTLLPANSVPSFTTTNTVYSGFQAMQYKFPEGAVFCRMENTISKRYGFMFSIHAGGYSER